MLRTSGRRIMAGLALLLAVGVVVAIVLASGGTTPSSRAASGASKVSGAATVQRRNLVQTDTESGTLSYSRPQTVYNRRGGTVTWLPSVGQLIKPGQPLYEIDGKPVILLDGTEPAYRDLKSSDSAGPDILQLNRTLAELGYGSGEITVDDEWQAGTTLGIDQLQGAVGLAVTGKFTLGQIVFLPGQQRVTTVDGTLGATEARAAVSGSPSTEFVDLTTPVTSTTTMTTPAATTTTTPTTPTTTAPTTTTPATGKGGHGDSPKRSGGNVTQQELQALTALLRAEIAKLRAQHRSPS